MWCVHKFGSLTSHPLCAEEIHVDPCWNELNIQNFVEQMLLRGSNITIYGLTGSFTSTGQLNVSALNFSSVSTFVPGFWNADEGKLILQTGRSISPGTEVVIRLFFCVRANRVKIKNIFFSLFGYYLLPLNPNKYQCGSFTIQINRNGHSARLKPHETTFSNLNLLFLIIFFKQLHSPKSELPAKQSICVSGFK